MPATILFTDEGKASLRKLDVFVQRRIKRQLKEIARKGTGLRDALRNELAGYFKCETGDYRAVYTRPGSQIVVHLVAHRNAIYDRMLAALRRGVTE